MRGYSFYVAVIFLGLVLSGCAGMQRRSPPSIDQLVEMANAGKPADEIVRELQETHAVYPLTASQIIGLHDRGVPDAVLDYMQNVYAESIRWNASLQYQGTYWWPNCFYCYGPPVIVAPY